MGKVITLANAKGGVGKSSSSTALAAILTERGYRTSLSTVIHSATAQTHIGQ